MSLKNPKYRVVREVFAYYRTAPNAYDSAMSRVVWQGRARDAHRAIVKAQRKLRGDLNSLLKPPAYQIRVRFRLECHTPNQCYVLDRHLPHASRDWNIVFNEIKGAGGYFSK